MRRVLVFQTAFLGDLILVSPLLKSLKRTFPGAEVSLVVRKGFEEVFRGAPFVSQIIPFDKKGVWKFSRLLASGDFELVVSPHRSHRTSLILWLSGIKRRIGFDKAGFSFFYTDRVKYRMGKGIHEIDRNLDLLRPLERDYSVVYDREPELPLTPAEVGKALKKFSLEKSYVVLAPGSVWRTKAWLPEYYAEVANYFKGKGLTVVLVGSPSDSPYCKRVEELSEGVINLCGKTSLREFFSVVKGALLVISNDSSPVHVAISVGTPVLEIYGATVPEFGFFPYRNGLYVELEDLHCRPCGIHGGRKCPEGHFKCMVDLKPEVVIEKAEELLSSLS
ncbi:glycosyltransferase family 9 protein [Phorcysia thermohydrogeniphila]|uniref:Heptosyltransferase-2 n=1 Tax=Phorcysia thermohydrogeniphila TaxID=936138 RepID=A0A4R1GEK1_9BACT|nr:glycosyltransferase family 9 protein [Phorcysia thermohydrogeniphila]TCK05230.1 heptosyltransferase-2 [Phorcysia thermohydrogeniphila]